MKRLILLIFVISIIFFACNQETYRPEFRVKGEDIDFIEIDDSEKELEIHYKEQGQLYDKFEEYTIVLNSSGSSEIEAEFEKDIGFCNN